MQQQLWEQSEKRNNQKREEKKKEDQRRIRVRRKKMQVREKVEKSQNIFFRCFVAPEGQTVGSLKRRVRSHLVGWDIKLPAAAAQSTFRSQNVKNITGAGLQRVHAAVAWSTCRSHNVNYTGKKPQTLWGEEVNVPDTSNSSYGTVADQVFSYIPEQQELVLAQETTPRLLRRASYQNLSYQDTYENFNYHQRRTFYIDDLRRSPYKSFLWASQMNSHTSITAEHLQHRNPRTSWRGFQQDIHRIFSERPARDHARTRRGFHQDLFKIFSQGPVQDHAKSAKVCDSMPLGSPQDLLTRTCTRACAPRTS